MQQILIPSWNSYKTSKIKGFSALEWLNHRDKMQNKELSLYEALYI